MKRTALLLDLAQLTAEIASAIFAQTGLTDAATIACAIALALDVLLRITWSHDDHEETDDSDNDEENNED